MYQSPSQFSEHPLDQPPPVEGQYYHQPPQLARHRAIVQHNPPNTNFLEAFGEADNLFHGAV
jgi:hypothetical protein